ncbi:MAG TPA: plastocyanin/azurin family copper-binding protein [Gemmatimonadales bacterium]|nr:plastocyanin/azurin family copper-binding protein [Gemmatimonadales bacterium]
MGIRQWQAIGLLSTIALAGCGSTYSPSGGGGGGGGGNGDPMAVSVGNDFFRSGQDGSANPAVNRVAVGQTVTWTWGNTGAVSHSVHSVGATTFPSSTILSGSGTAYQVTFQTAGTYHYNCAVHGDLMSGTVIVE